MLQTGNNNDILHMNRTRLLLVCLLFSAARLRSQVPGTPLLDTREPAAFPIVQAARACPIYVDSLDLNTVRKAASWLQRDIELVSGRKPDLLHAPAAPCLIIIGSLEHSALIRQLAGTKKINTDSLAGQWEAYQIQVVDAPLPGVEKALVIAGSDRRGTAYGVFDLSQMLGVSPWYWWADVPVRRREELWLRGDFFKTDKPVVRYRGIFINDEAPALSGWAGEKFGGFNAGFYEHVFELLLRLKANYLWPAMWGNAFYDDDPQNAALADEYGIVMGTSHHEPLGRAHDEWKRYGNEGSWDYARNDSSLRAFWRTGLERMKTYDKIVTVGMRGDGDKPMSHDTATALLERIVADQRQIIVEVTGKPPAETPQLWALYKEVQDYYDQGMRVDDDITLLLCDDNWGNLRKLPKPGAPPRAGGYGIYYHFDYVGGPRNYKWLNTNNIARVWEQMHLAWRYGADRIWIVNVGDIKPMEFPIQFFLDYAWNPGRLPVQQLRAYTAAWAARQFGPRYAADIAGILRDYTGINARRKPELLEPGTYSLAHYREAENAVAEYRRLETRAEAIYQALPVQYRDAFYQLVLFPVKACANLTDLYVTTAQNRLYAQQGRARTNELAQRAQALYAKDAELTRYYHDTLSGGKWNHMMAQTHIGYTYWQQPPEQTMPAQVTIELPAPADAGVSVEGLSEQLELPEINTALPQTRYIEIFNKGRAPFDFSITAEAPWLTLSATKGRVTDEQRIGVGVDATKAPKGRQRVSLRIETGTGQQFTVFAPVFNPELRGFYGFIAADHTISIAAEHFTNKVETGDIHWQLLPDIGRAGSGMTAFPVTAPPQTPSAQSPRLEYRIWAADTGTATVALYLSPTLNFNESASLRCAVSIDDETPEIANVTPDLSVRAWGQLVADNISIVKTAHRLKTPGLHTLKYWLVDAGVVLQKITLIHGPEKPSYLGAPETLVFLPDPAEKGLKDYYKDYFPIGVAVSPQLLDEVQAAGVIKREFNSLTAENAMKPGPIHPEEDRYNWAPADRIVEFAQTNGLRLRGHTLCWHNQTPDWFFKTNGRTATKAELLARLQQHIADVVGRYKGKIYAWDVVNEAVPDAGDSLYRPTEYYRIIGTEYIEKAFEYAHAADPGAKLFYNDYNTENPAKRERIYRLLKALKDKGVPIHGVGLQGHWSIYEPEAAELEASIQKFASLGLEIQFTEVDVSVYPKEHSARAHRPTDLSAFTPEQEQRQAAHYNMLFGIFRKYKDQITGVTFWNLSDRHSWLDDFPVPGRKDYPLLFDENMERKKAYQAVTEF